MMDETEKKRRPMAFYDAVTMTAGVLSNLLPAPRHAEKLQMPSEYLRESGTAAGAGPVKLLEV